MESEHKVHKCVTEFMLNTCGYTNANDRELSRSFHSVFTAYFSDLVEAFASGSFAEFYIKPMLPHIGDIDIMMPFDGCLAIPAGHTPPTEFADHFQQFVIVYEIVDSHQSGYVYLKPSYILKKKGRNGFVVEKMKKSEDEPEFSRIPDNQMGVRMCTREVTHIFLNHYLKQGIPKHLLQPVSSIAAQPHGPALAYTSHIQIPAFTGEEISKVLNSQFPIIDFDIVRCIRCLLWPPQAADWPTRSRTHGEPNQTTIDMVVSNGCDVVGAVHPSHKQDEWMNEHQWRLSFSRAEVTLLNNWKAVQQITYHMLRFVLKREVFSKTDGKEQELPKLSNYHIKTLMLWECEKKPQSWWSAESSLIKRCSSLLHKLSDWVEDKHCQHYFVSNCNILSHFQNASLTLRDDLRCLADSSVLLTWFVDNYIRDCAQCCPDKVSALFEDIQSADKLDSAVQAIVEWKSNVRPIELYLEYYSSERKTLLDLQMFGVNIRALMRKRQQLQRLDSQFLVYFIAVVSLHVAYRVSIHSLTIDHLEMLWMLFDPFNAAVSDTFTNKFESGGLLSIKKAIKLASLSTVRSPALEMLHKEMSKAFLHHSFAYREKSTYSVVHLLLAALYYKSGHYQSAIAHCTQVLNQRDHDQDGLLCIGAEYLPQIDESVDAVLGFVLLHQHIRGNALHSDINVQLDSVCLPAFTVQLLADYLYSKCSTLTTKAKVYRQRLSETIPLLLSDVLLYKAMEMQLAEGTETPVAEAGSENACSSMDSSLLLTVLQQVALENLTAFRQAMVREVHCEQFPVVNEFEVLYMYNCGLFEECMKSCGQAIDTLLRSGSLVHQAYFVAIPEMLFLLDGELVSFFGIIRLLHPKSIFPINIALESPMLNYLGIRILTLLLYLLVHCQVNLLSDSLHDTMNLICYVHDRVYPADSGSLFDRLILRLTYRSLKLYMKAVTDSHSC